jgi:hypothetical protein
MNNVEKQATSWGFWVLSEGNVIAGVVSPSFVPKGPCFVTPPEFGLQVAVMERPAFHRIPSHFHLPVPRSLVGTQEVILVRQGKLRSDLFDDDSKYLGSVILGPGELLILNSGGHGFEATEDCLFIEVKQGPYVEGKDKEIFPNTVGSETPIRLIE